jgi:hypothetical protein
VVGLVLVGGFFAVVFAYVFTEYLIVRFDVRERMVVGDGHPLLTILTLNAVSFAIVSASSAVFITASGTALYAEGVLVCALAQAVWLTQHLWFYHRHHVRLRYE